jgi:SAM-dependent methyltransferase
MKTFTELVAEAAAVPLQGWDFTWLAGRAEGSEPSWSYPDLARSLVQTLVRANGRLLDLDTGGGELLASLGPLPPRTVATEGWPPNVPVARERLEPLGAEVRFAPAPTLPAGPESADLVLNRHGRLHAGEISRVLRPGGRLLTQQVGSDDCAEINESLGASPAYGERWDAETATTTLQAAGLTVTDVRQEHPTLVFHDVGALVFQLRQVSWQVPGFTVDRYEDALRRIDRRIRRQGEFTVHAHRFLIQAHR